MSDTARYDKLHGILTEADARDNFYDILADLDTFADLNDLTPEQAQWLELFSDGIMQAAERWVQICQPPRTP